MTVSPTRDAEPGWRIAVSLAPVEIPSSARALLEGPALAHLVTLNPDGSPQVSIVWVGLDGEELVSAHMAERQKVKTSAATRASRSRSRPAPDSCSLVYRPLAELLIGSGLSISEAIALQLGDLDLEDSGGVILVYRSRKKGKVGSTKSDRFRAVEIGPALSAVVRE